VQPADPAAGEIEVVGGAPVTIAGNETIAVRGRRTSTARENISLVVSYQGSPLAEETLSVCDVRIVDAAFADLSTALIGLWENAHDGSGNVRGNFIDLDPRRFYVQVTDWDKAIDPANPDVITARIGVDDPIDGDDPTSIPLVETGPNTGLFRSYAQLAVSPDFPTAYFPDDDYKAHNGISGRVEDDAAGDRTHHTSIHGTFQVFYQSGPDVVPTRIDIPVCRGGGVATCDQATPDTPCKVEIDVTVFNEPFQDSGWGPANTGANNNRFSFDDVNNNNIHEPGEDSEPFIDISEGASTFRRAGSWGWIRSRTEIGQDIEFASIGWQQACIEVTEFAITPEDPPLTGPAPSPSILHDAEFDGIYLLPGAPYGSDEEIVIDEFPPPAGPANHPLQVFYVSLIPDPARVVGAYASLPARRITQGWPEDDDTAIFVGPLATIERNAFGHELGHVLTNGFDRPALENLRFLLFRNTKSTLLATPGVNQMRRVLLEDATDNARRTRAAQGLPGNRVLEDP